MGRLSSLLNKDNVGDGVFVIRSSDFDTSKLNPGENHWRDFVCYFKKNLGVELVDLESAHGSDSTSGLLVDVLKSELPGSLLAVIPQEKNVVDFYLTLKEHSHNDLEGILEAYNFNYEKINSYYKLELKELIVKLHLVEEEYLNNKVKKLRRDSEEISKQHFALFYKYDDALKRNIWLPRKIYHDYNFVRNAAYEFGIKLLKFIKQENINSVLVYSIRRGGSVIGDCIVEILNKKREESEDFQNLIVQWGDIKATRYEGMNGGELKIDYIFPTIEESLKYDLIVFAEDLVDHGVTLNALIKRFDREYKSFNKKLLLKLAVLDIKDRTYKDEKKPNIDYFKVKLVIPNHKGELWIVYSHELTGLTSPELKSKLPNYLYNEWKNL